MRPKKPIRVSIEQVRITRDGPTAVIEYADPAYSGVNLTIGDHVAQMSDQQVVDVLNDVLAAQAQSLREWDNTVTEIPSASRRSSSIAIPANGYRRARYCAASSRTTSTATPSS